MVGHALSRKEEGEFFFGLMIEKNRMYRWICFVNVAVLILSCESLFAVAIGNKLGFLKQFRNSLGRDNSSVAISGSPFVISSARCESYAEMLKARKPHSPKRETIVKYGTNFFIGCLYTTVIKVMNRLTVVRREELYSHVFGRDKGRGLLTYSNHQSMADDPGLWVALLPWWRMHPEQFRWGLCTQDVFFSVRLFAIWLTIADNILFLL